MVPSPVKRGLPFEGTSTYAASFVSKPLPPRGVPQGNREPAPSSPFNAVTTNQELYRPYTIDAPEKPVSAEYTASKVKFEGSTTNEDMMAWMILETPEDTLGVEMVGGAFHCIVTGNLKRPTRREQTFTTVEDGQTEVTVKILQEQREAKTIRALGEMDLISIPPMKAGRAKVLVTFDIHQDGALHVRASLILNGKSTQKVNINLRTPREGPDAYR